MNKHNHDIATDDNVPLQNDSDVSRCSDYQSADYLIQSHSTLDDVNFTNSYMSSSSSTCSDEDDEIPNLEVNESVTIPKLFIEAHSLPDFGNVISNTYFEQDYNNDLYNN